MRFQSWYERIKDSKTLDFSSSVEKTKAKRDELSKSGWFYKLYGLLVSKTFRAFRDHNTSFWNPGITWTVIKKENPLWCVHMYYKSQNNFQEEGGFIF